MNDDIPERARAAVLAAALTVMPELRIVIPPLTHLAQAAGISRQTLHADRARVLDAARQHTSIGRPSLKAWQALRWIKAGAASDGADADEAINALRVYWRGAGDAEF